MFSAGAGYVRNLLRRIPTIKSLADMDRDSRRSYLDAGRLTVLSIGAFILLMDKMKKRTMSLHNSEERRIELHNSEERRIELYKWILQQNEKESPRTEEERRAKLERELLIKALLEEEENKATTTS